MRSAFIAVAVGLLAVAVLFMLWPRALGLSAAPPGQYPIDRAPSVAWPVAVKDAPYHPVRGMGSNTVAFTDAAAPKAACVGTV
jgi:hypothetical protein